MMANSILTMTMVTREALRILHQKLNFVGSINRQYDDSFAKSGAKIGDTLKIRLPNQYTVRTGATLTTQDTTESSVSLQVATQKGVDLNFTSVDLTMNLDDFSKRILDPAMSVLAANVEADALSMYKDVNSSTWNMGSAATLAKVLGGRKRLNDQLCPINDRTALLNTQDMVDVVTDGKSLFNQQTEIGNQYKEGFVGRAAGFDFAENTLLGSHTRGTANTGYLVNSAAVASGDTTLPVDTGTGTLKKGDVITIANVNRVHPETKVSTGAPHQFVVTADYAGGAGTISVSPAFISTGGSQNIDALPQDNAVITVAGSSGSTGVSLLYNQDAFAFATADLVMPQGVDMAAREVQDGLSIRLVRQYDINNDKFPCRLDILYGYKTIRAQLAHRLHNN